EDLLHAGATKARKIATPFIGKLRHAVGLRDLRSQSQAATKKTKAALPSFKQYREKDGQFYFKFVDAAGKLLLQSKGFASPKEAGQAIGRLLQEGAVAVQALEACLDSTQAAPAAELTSAFDALKMAKEAGE
ncbi:MAG: hypothetical protein RLZZ271_1684, partial [Pseudomonadota bacterium]